jgi:hypothetical protein
MTCPFDAREEQLAADLWPVLRGRAENPMQALRALHLLTSALLHEQERRLPPEEWTLLRRRYLGILRSVDTSWYVSKKDGLYRLSDGPPTVMLKLGAAATPPPDRPKLTWDDSVFRWDEEETP